MVGISGFCMVGIKHVGLQEDNFLFILLAQNCMIDLPSLPLPLLTLKEKRSSLTSWCVGGDHSDLSAR